MTRELDEPVEGVDGIDFDGRVVRLLFVLSGTWLIPSGVSHPGGVRFEFGKIG